MTTTRIESEDNMRPGSHLGRGAATHLGSAGVADSVALPLWALHHGARQLGEQAGIRVISGMTDE